MHALLRCMSLFLWHYPEAFGGAAISVSLSGVDLPRSLGHRHGEF